MQELINDAARLQAKKNALRKDLAARGILQKGATNSYDHYKYFSEAQYKALFTELFSAYGLEHRASEVSVTEFQGTNSQPIGRRVTMDFTLTDVETGYGETCRCSGEGIDKGDKAIYKAQTGALKYYLATTYMVATGDDPENETQPPKPAQKPAPKPKQAAADPDAKADKVRIIKLKAKAMEQGVPEYDLNKWWEEQYGKTTPQNLTPEQRAAAIDYLENLTGAKA